MGKDSLEVTAHLLQGLIYLRVRNYSSLQCLSTTSFNNILSSSTNHDRAIPLLPPYNFPSSGIFNVLLTHAALVSIDTRLTG